MQAISRASVRFDGASVYEDTEGAIAEADASRFEGWIAPGRHQITIRIESAGKDGQSHFDFIRHPDGVQHEIYRQMEARNMPVAMVQSAPTVAAPPQAGAAVPEQIEQLARLRDQGHITAAEFEAKKAELLGRM